MLRRCRIGRCLAVFLFALGLGSAPLGKALGELSSKALPAEGKTLVVEVEGEIELGLAAFIRRVLNESQTGDLVIFHINTPGGRIDAAITIRDAILASKAHTVAFIDRRAISAGAFIALSTDTIVMARGALFGDATPVSIEGGKMAPVEAKVVSYFRKEMKETAKAKGHCGNLPSSREDCGLIAEAMVDGDVQIPGYSDKGKPLILDTDQAMKLGIAALQSDNIDGILKYFKREAGAATLKPAINWAERIARFLSQSTVSSLLMTLGMLGILIELWAPGHAIAGVLGVICLLLFFLGHYIVHLAGLEEILLFVAGVVAVGFEVFFWAGHGLLAVLGICAIIASLVMALVNMHQVPLEISWSLGWVPRALVHVFGSILATTAAMFVVARFLPKTRFGRSLILQQTLQENAGAAAAQTAEHKNATPATAAHNATPLLRGQSGIAETTLRPAGKVKIDGKRFDVVSEDGFIEAGTEIEVIAVDESRIVVRRHKV